MAVSISSILDPRCIALELEAKKKTEIIGELVDLLARAAKTTDAEKLCEEVLSREKLSTTGIGSGIAIPHVLSAAVDETTIAFGRKLDGVRFDAVDNQPVSIFFLLVGPVGSYAEHLRALSKLARYLHDRTFCQALLDAASPEAVVDILRRKEEASS